MNSPSSLVLFHGQAGYEQAWGDHASDPRTPAGNGRLTTVAGKPMLPPLPPLFGFTDHRDVLHINIGQFSESTQILTAFVPTYAHRKAHEHFGPTMQLAMAEHLMPPHVRPLSINLRRAMNHLAAYLGEGTIEKALFRGEVKAFDRALQQHMGTPQALAYLEHALSTLQRTPIDIRGVSAAMLVGSEMLGRGVMH